MLARFSLETNGVHVPLFIPGRVSGASESPSISSCCLDNPGKSTLRFDVATTMNVLSPSSLQQRVLITLSRGIPAACAFSLQLEVGSGRITTEALPLLTSPSTNRTRERLVPIFSSFQRAVSGTTVLPLE